MMTNAALNMNSFQRTLCQRLPRQALQSLNWNHGFGYFATSKTAPEIFARLRAELTHVIAAPDVVDAPKRRVEAASAVALDYAVIVRDAERRAGLLLS